jgi:two-component system sensor histidine kinase/response regulator FitF
MPIDNPNAAFHSPGGSERARQIRPGRPVVLVVDDVEATRTGLAQLLRLRGCETHEAANGAEALKALRAYPDVSAVVLDLSMPGTDGYWFRQQQLADAALAAIPVIVFTGSADVERTREHFSAAQVFLKPLSVDQLIAAVNNACAM